MSDLACIEEKKYNEVNLITFLKKENEKIEFYSRFKMRVSKIKNDDTNTLYVASDVVVGLMDIFNKEVDSVERISIDKLSASSMCKGIACDVVIEGSFQIKDFKGQEKVNALIRNISSEITANYNHCIEVSFFEKCELSGVRYSNDEIYEVAKVLLA